jgi:hypothetical protein
VPALGLGAERPDQDVMQRPPRTRQDRLLTPGLLVRAYLFLGTFEALAAMAAFSSSSPERMAIRGASLDERCALPTSHHGVPDRDRRDAGGERPSLP